MSVWGVVCIAVCAGVSVNVYMNLRVSVQYLCSCVRVSNDTYVSMCVPLCTCEYICAPMCVSLCTSLHACRCHYMCVGLYLVCAEPWWGRKAKVRC